jgi:hypothetical protein
MFLKFLIYFNIIFTKIFFQYLIGKIKITYLIYYEPMENKSEQNRCNLNIDFPIPDIENKTFQSIFTFIRKKLQIKPSRKNHIDSLLKKSKGKFFRAIFEGIKLCLNLRIYRLPQEFITNITIDYNKKYLNKKIIDIYQEFNLLPTLKEILDKKLYKNGKLEIFKEMVSYDYITLYDIYTKSNRFKRDVDSVKVDEGKRIAVLYEFVAKNFCVYYLNRKEQKKKTLKKILFKISNK